MAASKAAHDAPQETKVALDGDARLRELIDPPFGAPVHLARATKVAASMAAVHSMILAAQACSDPEIVPVMNVVIRKLLGEFRRTADDWLEVVTPREGPAIN